MPSGLVPASSGVSARARSSARAISIIGGAGSIVIVIVIGS